MPDGKGSGGESSGGIGKRLVEEVGHEPAREADLGGEAADDEFVVTLVDDDFLPPFFVWLALVSLEQLCKDATGRLPPAAVQSNVCFDRVQ